MLIHKTVEFTWSVFNKNTRWFILNRFILNYYYYDNFSPFRFNWNEMTVECNRQKIKYEMHLTRCQIEFRIDCYNFDWMAWNDLKKIYLNGPPFKNQVIEYASRWLSKLPKISFWLVLYLDRQVFNLTFRLWFSLRT